MHITEFDGLDGEAFEHILRTLLVSQGFTNIKLTPKTADFGADIIAEKDGRKSAIQAKRSTSPVGLPAVQQVLGALHYYSCDNALVISNATFTSNAKKLAEKAAVTLVDRPILKRWINQLKLGERPAAITPHPHQVRALDALKNERRQRANKALVIMASGLGKTYVAAFDCLNFENSVGRPCRTLYLAHQSVILEQAKRSFISVFGKNRSYGRFDGELREKGKEFTFATFQSFYNSLSAIDPTEFDYVVVDEAHHTVAPTRDAAAISPCQYSRHRFWGGCF